MNYFLKDIIEIYPLNENVVFPSLESYLSPQWKTAVTSSGIYNTSNILSKIERKYKYNEIATSDISQFYDMLNQLIDENFYEYVMNLLPIAEYYSIQNTDTVSETVSHTVDTESTNLSIENNTPSNKLNIENIKSGSSASNVVYDTTKDSNYTDTTTREATSPLNTTQSNVEAQFKVNKMGQEVLNKFIDKLSSAFAISSEMYYKEI